MSVLLLPSAPLPSPDLGKKCHVCMRSWIPGGCHLFLSLPILIIIPSLASGSPLKLIAVSFCQACHSLSFLAQDVLGFYHTFPVPALGNPSFLQGPWFILVQMVFRSQDLGAGCAHCYQGEASLSLSGEKMRECRCVYTSRQSTYTMTSIQTQRVILMSTYYLNELW